MHSPATTGETVELSQQLQQSVFRAQALESTLKECESELELFKDCNERVSAERDEAQEQLEATAVALEETQSELSLLQTRARSLEEECAKFKILQQEHTGELASLIIVHEEKMSKLQQRLIEAAPAGQIAPTLSDNLWRIVLSRSRHSVNWSIDFARPRVEALLRQDRQRALVSPLATETPPRVNATTVELQRMRQLA